MQKNALKITYPLTPRHSGPQQPWKSMPNIPVRSYCLSKQLCITFTLADRKWCSILLSTLTSDLLVYFLVLKTVLGITLHNCTEFLTLCAILCLNSSARDPWSIFSPIHASLGIFLQLLYYNVRRLISKCWNLFFIADVFLMSCPPSKITHYQMRQQYFSIHILFHSHAA